MFPASQGFPLTDDSSDMKCLSLIFSILVTNLSDSIKFNNYSTFAWDTMKALITRSSTGDAGIHNYFYQGITIGLQVSKNKGIMSEFQNFNLRCSYYIAYWPAQTSICYLQVKGVFCVYEKIDKVQIEVKWSLVCHK